jgi:hypothetical protein
MQADAVVGDESLYKIEYVSPMTNDHTPEAILYYEPLRESKSNPRCCF